MKNRNPLPLLSPTAICRYGIALWSICLPAISSLFAQSNIRQSLSINNDGSAAAASALLDVSATDKGMLVPRMTSAQRTMIASPATGLLVFDMDTGGFWFYNGTVWADLSAPKTLADADGDTKIQVEENPDEDLVRFDLGGTESMVLRQNAAGATRLELPGAAGNTFVGQNAGSANTTGVSNTAGGASALGFNTGGSFNTAGGNLALTSNTEGSNNTASGYLALAANTTGSVNTASGSGALALNTSGFNNTADGQAALYSNSTGSNNTASGQTALYFNSTGYANTANGQAALYANTTGANNTACGTTALYANTEGFDNTAGGASALAANLGGSSNTACGVSALAANTTGSHNSALGHSADVASGNLSNASAFGSGATVNASNKVRIGNSAVTVIEGQVDWTFPSDARFKFDISDEGVPGLAFINRLRPVTYRFDTRKFDLHLLQNLPDSLRQSRPDQGSGGQDYSENSPSVQTGFLAQEVEQVCKNLGFEFSGLHVPLNEADNYGLAYGSFVPLLVKAMQEQQAEIGNLKMEIVAIKKTLANAGIAGERH